MVRGYTLFGEALAREGVETGFYIMGGPINDAVKAAISGGVRMVDTRHEQAAAMAAQAYARVKCKPGLCMGASGPGTINLTLGLANALVDCAPVVAFGGASPVGQYLQGSFQEVDQLAIMRPVTKWAERVYDARRIPEYVNIALRRAMAGKPGPVYIDLPGDVLYAEVDEAEVVWPKTPASAARSRPAADAATLSKVADALAKAKRPVIVTGSGILWSQASEQLGAFVDATGIPFYTTPQGRGVIPEDHPYFYAHARSTAFKEADLVLVVGTRLNYVISHARPPRFSGTATIVQIDTDADAVGASDRVDIGIVADAAAVLEQLRDAVKSSLTPDGFAEWREQLATVERKRAPKHEDAIATDQTPVHPLRLCKEVRDFVDRDAILVVDGQEILNFGRQTIPTYRPGHRLNSGPFGTMGVGMPFGVGAKAARPDAQVVVLHGDGSFGLNAMELDTAARHGLPLLIVISLNGGWTADPTKVKPGRDLGYTRFDKMAESLGCYGEYVERPEDIRPALERGAAAVSKGQTAVINVVTDWRAQSTTASFTAYRT
ncbi:MULTISPECIES: thiamine pyrophosphate-binding protein [unclassified Mesorhizobium]|uniref:thiamine pyrophosphate-binding protein n=1 Tax=unclassified Mesorhizobium TaxID=325217 RepID=UPI00112E2920|nr:MULTISPECIES: thiamine pyrophosphate-binding protein [unclassified Mesorhizobium]MBZ9699569.1 thiamine pyrophosphate-binding protein [Mesorhizobium sp. CO1-1-3]MBZ9945821.1 thiamine pyrophosphate-binding protein [Mesorhizobium sp. BR1-1-11]TPJ08251.1 thiamine pyrophosphate-binding protein [Mesorhizobium sp. B2-8-1]